MQTASLRGLLRDGVALAACVFGGCDDGAARPAGAPSGAQLRVASLSPALTDVFLHLDCGGTLVARTPWCLGADDVPVAGTLLDVNAELLAACDPDVILVQPPAQGAPPEVVDLASREGWSVAAIQIHTLDDVAGAIRIVADALEADSTGPCHERALELESNLNTACSALAEAPRLGKVLALSSVSDGGALGFGPGSYIADALERMGCQVTDPGGAYAQLTVEGITSLDADTIIVIQSQRAATDTPMRLGVEAGARTIIVHAESLLQPGASLADGLQQLRVALSSDVPGDSAKGLTP